MNLLAVSDLHLNPTSDTLNRSFLVFLETAQSQGDQVLILGDLFDLWFGNPDLSFPYQAPILDRMADFALKGLVMDYVEGNRDFGISKLRGKVFRDVYKDSIQVKWGDRWIHAEHGDLINLDDRQYRLWRKVIKSNATFFLIDRLPSSFLLRTALYLEKRLKSTNVRNKMQYPEQRSKDFCAKQRTSGMDIVIVGHFHVEREWEMAGEQGNMLFYNLPGWETGLRYLVIPQTNDKPYFKELK
jgi:UDP-2,3-diacylglucosamine hydrolase